jgi:ketosteroid isomerase-like protein
MVRTSLAVFLCVGLVPAAAAAGDRQSLDAVIRNYDRAEIATGTIQVSASGDIAYVSGTSEKGPWLDVWHHTAGKWKMVAEVMLADLGPVRFGAKRERSCRTS